MSEKDKIIQLLDYVPEYKLGYVLAYVQGITADEDSDDEYCRKLYEEYLTDYLYEKRKAGMGSSCKLPHSHSLSIPSSFVLLPKVSRYFQSLYICP